MDKSINTIMKLIETLLGRHPGGVSEASAPDTELAAYRLHLSANSPSAEELEAQAGEDTAGLPLFAVAIAGEGEEGDIRRTAEALTLQSYSRWKLISSPQTEDFDYIIYMWPGDSLPPHALYELAHAAAGHDLICCDEDRWGEEGRCQPRFKPELSHITQLSYDMLGCGVAVSRELFRAAGPMRGCEPKDRYAYNLRCMNNCAAPLHIPRVLYTCREYREVGHEGRLAVEGAMKEQGAMALPGLWKGSFRVEAGPKEASVALIIHSRNRYEPLMALLSSIDRASRPEKLSIVIADHGSTDSRTQTYYRILEQNGAARIYRGEGLSTPALLNAAAREADCDMAVFMESYVEALSVNWIAGLLAQATRRGAGAAGPKLIGADGRLMHTGTVIGIGGWQGSAFAGAEDDCRSPLKQRLANSLRAVSALSSVCMMLPMDTFFDIGCFDESFQEVGFDTELCLRLRRRGYACIYTPNVAMRCNRPIPAISAAPEGDQLRCYDAMRETLLSGDPYYSLNYGYSSPIPGAAIQPSPPILLNERYGGQKNC